MSHSIRAPGPIQFKICRKTPARGLWKMFSWLRDIINNSKLLMSSSPQHSLSILVYTIQEIDSLAIRCVKTTCQLNRFPETTVTIFCLNRIKHHCGPTLRLFLCDHTASSSGLWNEGKDRKWINVSIQIHQELSGMHSTHSVCAYQENYHLVYWFIS